MADPIGAKKAIKKAVNSVLPKKPAPKPAPIADMRKKGQIKKAKRPF